MSFQIYFSDLRHGNVETRVSVANSEEEFRNTTVQELKRKLIPEDQLEDSILRCRFKTLKKNRTLGFYGIKHEDHIIAVRRRIAVREKCPRDSSPVHESTVSCTIYFETLTGRRPVDVDSEELENMTAGELKRRVDCTSQGDPYILLFGGRELEDDRTLRDCGIKHESTVHLVKRRRRRERRTIYVKDVTGYTTPVDVDSEELENMTVGEFKRRVHPQGDEYRLYRGKTLEDDRTLQDYGIKHESIVHMIRRLPGGGPKETQPPPEDEEDEDKLIPRSQSMDNLLDLNQPQQWCKKMVCAIRGAIVKKI